MLIALTLFTLIPMVALMLIAYRRPGVLRTSTFRFARAVTGVMLFFFAATSILSDFKQASDEAFAVWVGAVGATWICVIVSIRGVFEVLELTKE